MEALPLRKDAGSDLLAAIDRSFRDQAMPLGAFDRAAYFLARRGLPDAEEAFAAAWADPPSEWGLLGGLGAHGLLARALYRETRGAGYDKIANQIAELAAIELETDGADLRTTPLGLATGLSGLGLFAVGERGTSTGRMLLDTLLGRLVEVALAEDAHPWQNDGGPLPPGLFDGELGIRAFLAQAAPLDRRAASLLRMTDESIARKTVSMAGALALLDGTPSSPDGIARHERFGLGDGALGWFAATHDPFVSAGRVASEEANADDGRNELFLMTAGREWSFLGDADISLRTGTAGFAVCSMMERPFDYATTGALIERLEGQLDGEAIKDTSFFDGLSGAAATLHALHTGTRGWWFSLLGYGTDAELTVG
jgi:hypothetical protein